MQMKIFGVIFLLLYIGYFSCSTNQFFNGSICSTCSDEFTNCYSCNRTDCQVCLSNYFLTNINDCRACSSNCIACRSINDCYQCDNDYILDYSGGGITCVTCLLANCNCSNSQCASCDDGFYLETFEQDFNMINRNFTRCVTCSNTCQTCSSILNCTSCRISFYLNINQCEHCPSECLSCYNTTSCLQCISDDYYYQNDQCISCPYLCICVNSSYCYSCIYGAYKINGECEDICGDEIAVDHPCDLQLGTDYDGCTNICQIQTDFTCRIDQNTLLSTCSYIGQTIIKLINIQKQMFNNKINIDFQISPNLPLYKSIDPNLIYFFDEQAIKDYTFSYSYNTATLSVEIIYQKDLQSKQIILIFNESQHIDQRFWATNRMQKQFILLGNQFLPIYYYSQTQYMYSQIILIFSYVLSSLGIIICLIGIFSPNKLAGLQIMFVIQYAFISLLWYNVFLYLPFYCLRGLLYSVGYNYPFYQLNQLAIPNNAQTFDINTQYFLANFNIMGVFYLIPIIGFIILKMLNPKQTDIQKKILYQQRQQFFLQLLLYISMFNLTYLIVCAILYYFHGNISNIINQAILIIIILITIISFLGLIIYSQYFLRFRFSFKNSQLAYHHYVFHILCIILSILFIQLLPNNSWLPFIPQGFVLLYTIIYRPYKHLLDNLRSIFYYLILCSITSMRFYLQQIDQKQRRNLNIFLYPGIVMVLIFIGIVWAYISTLHDIIDDKCFKKNRKKNLQFQLFDEEQIIKKIQNIQNFKARSILQSFQSKKLHQTTQIDDEKMYKSIVEEIKNKLKNQKSSKKKNIDISNESQLKQFLKRQSLPCSKEAMQIIMNQSQFLRYHKLVWLNRQKFTKPIDQSIKQIYNGI